MSRRDSIIITRKGNLRKHHPAYKDAVEWACTMTRQTGDSHAVFYDDMVDAMVVARYGAKDKLPRMGWCAEIAGGWTIDDSPEWGA